MDYFDLLLGAILRMYDEPKFFLKMQYTCLLQKFYRVCLVQQEVQ